MGASFTLAGEDLIARKQAAKQTLTVSRFILANVPGLNPNGPVDRAAGKPAAAQIISTYPVTQAGYVNPSQVVYSLMLGSDVGDFDWNWIGLESAEGVLLMVAYVPLQQKRRNIPPLQLGNNVTRNFLLKFDGAQELTAVTIDASTWQHDFTVRLAGIDERERLGNRDMFGRACFFGSALQLEKAGSAYRLKPGTAYVEGVRIDLTTAQAVAVPATPTKAWLDVVLQRELSDVVGAFQIVFGTAKADYTDTAGAKHYLVPLADIPSSTVIADLRTAEPVTTELIKHFAARVGDYPDLRARATTKADVELDQIPNAISDAVISDSSQVLATTRMVQAIRALIQQAIDALISGASVAGKAARLATARTIGGVAFDGSANINLPGVNTPGNQSTSGNSASATKLQTARAINGVPFDGTAPITILARPEYTLIPANTDLDTLTTPGDYYCPANVTVATLRNCPTSNAFYLKVSAHAGTRQELSEYMNSSAKSWYRNRYGSPWGNWYRVYSESDPQPDVPGNAATATKLQTPRAINGVPFDGSAAITIQDATRLPLAGGAITGPIIASTRQAGNYGVYDSAKIDHLWAMGSAYRIAVDGSDFGNLYGLAYKHTNNPAGGNMAGGHQIVFCSNGVPGAAIGLGGNIWAAGAYYGSGAGLTDIPQTGVAGLVAALAAKAALASPAFTGTPTAPTQAQGDSSTRLATTAFVQRAIVELGVAMDLSTPGYLKIAGFILQWGKVVISSSGGGATFPVQFPTTSDPIVMLTYAGSVNDDTRSLDVTGTTNAGFSARNWGGSGTTVNYIAIGS